MVGSRRAAAKLEDAYTSEESNVSAQRSVSKPATTHPRGVLKASRVDGSRRAVEKLEDSWASERQA